MLRQTTNVRFAENPQEKKLNFQKDQEAARLALAVALAEYFTMLNQEELFVPTRKNAVLRSTGRPYSLPEG